MAERRVLVIGCVDETGKTGLLADEKVLKKYGCAIATASTGLYALDSEKVAQITEAPHDVLEQEISDSIKAGVDAVKIGALYNEATIITIASALQTSNKILTVVDTEAILKTGRPTPPSVLRALHEKLLPLTTILSATVPEAKLLLDNAGVPAEYPKNMDDVKTLAKAVRTLGPEWVLIKREIFDEKEMKTTLHFVLCGEGEPLVVGSRFENPGGLTGLSYQIPTAIGANLAGGLEVPKAVSAAFKFVEDMVTGKFE